MRCLGVALLVAIGWCSAAKAIPVEIQYTGVTGTLFTSQQFQNEPITIDIFADNGGTSIDSQFWCVASCATNTQISTTITIGSSYSVTMSGPVTSNSVGSFATNASGQLISLVLNYTQSGTDNSDGFTSFAIAMQPFNSTSFVTVGGTGFLDFLSTITNYLGPDNINTTIISLAPTTTPLPAALPLFATALAA
jgi:hypothetical protein